MCPYWVRCLFLLCVIFLYYMCVQLIGSLSILECVNCYSNSGTSLNPFSVTLLCAIWICFFTSSCAWTWLYQLLIGSIFPYASPFYFVLIYSIVVCFDCLSFIHLLLFNLLLCFVHSNWIKNLQVMFLVCSSFVHNVFERLSQNLSFWSIKIWVE